MLFIRTNIIIQPNNFRYVSQAPDSHGSVTQLCVFTLGLDRKKVTVVRRSLTILGSTFGADSISEEVAGFSQFMVSPWINIVFIVSCI